MKSPKNTELLEKCELLHKCGSKLPEKRKKKKGFLLSGQTPFLNCDCHPWYGIFPLANLGYLSGCAPSQLLHTCSLAEYGKLEKVMDFIATTKNTSAISIVLTLNPKHSSYWKKINSIPAETRRSGEATPQILRSVMGLSLQERH